ncbi:MAG: hypothetical protein JWP12_359 [Bacteroidetes bacterium]|nr:hypothetical protein [Bacteroidota bacterium]
MLSTNLRGQGTEIDRLITGELKMVYPGIYFKHNSTDYAAMPYTSDSCFKYIAHHVREIYSYVIWRDSTETDELTNKRIKKLKVGLNKYIPTGKIEIHPMGKEQKISRQTINCSINDEQRQYLLSLNSVFDISTIRFLTKKKNHIEHPRIWCLSCWKSGFHIKARRELHKMAKKQAATTQGP